MSLDNRIRAIELGLMFCGEVFLDAFEKLLLENQESRFLVVSPLGDKTDRLVYMGMEKKLKELSIRHRISQYGKTSFFHRVGIKTVRVLSESGLEFFEEKLRAVGPYNRTVGVSQNAPEDIILIRGGGYFNDIWKEYKVLDDVRRAIRNMPQTTIIIAPGSFFFTTTNFPEILKGIKQELHIFCREKTSYGLLCSFRFPQNVHIHLSHDTALYLSRKDFNLKNEKTIPRQSYVLIASRRDRESVVNWRAENMSRKMKTLLGDIQLMEDFNSFVNVIANAYKVYTDRLHVSILSAIFGKETHLYPNSYHKNKSVYEFSLRKFPNVRFVDSLEFQG